MPTPPSSIIDGEQFQLLTESIACDMQSLAFHWRLYQDLEQSVEDYETELNQSRAFWQLTFAAHRDASLFRVCRLYDQHKTALNLKNWLVALRDTPAHFGRSQSRPCSSTLEADIESVSDGDEVVKKVVLLRNNLVAHRAVKPIVSPDSFSKHCGIPTADVNTLVDRARELVNRYTSLLNRESYSTTLVGNDDYNYVLKSIRDQLKGLDT